MLAVRENTRRNASAHLVPRPIAGDNYTTPTRSAKRGSRRIKFASLPGDAVISEKDRAQLGGLRSTPSPPPTTTLLEQAVTMPGLPSDPTPLSRKRSFLSRMPRTTTPWGSSVLPTSGAPIILPRAKISRPEPAYISSSASGAAAAASSSTAWDPEKSVQGEGGENVRHSKGSFSDFVHGRRLRHMPSAISSESLYSTQSGEPRRETALPTPGHQRSNPQLREQRSGFFATLRQQLDVNRLSAFSLSSYYSFDEEHE
jgi:hypothetical protein